MTTPSVASVSGSVVERVRPPVEHIINDHAGTVLDEPPPAPSLTREEERRALKVYQEAMRQSLADLRALGTRPPSAKNAKNGGAAGDDGEAGGGDEEGGDELAETAAVAEDGGGDGGGDENGGGDNGEDDGDEAGGGGGGGKEEKGALERAEAEAAARAAKDAADAAARAGLSLAQVGACLVKLGFTLDEPGFDRHVRGFFRDHGLLPPLGLAPRPPPALAAPAASPPRPGAPALPEGGGGGEATARSVGGTAIPTEATARLELEGFLALVSVVYAPGHKFGSRLRKAASRADDGRVKDLMARGCDPLGVDGGGFSALHYAAQGGHAGTCRALLAFAQQPPAAFARRLPGQEAIFAAKEAAEERGKAGDAGGKGTAPAAKGGAKGKSVEKHGDDDGGRVGERADDEEEEEEEEEEANVVDEKAAAAAAAAAVAKRPEGKYGPYYDAMIEATDNSGWTPLMVAAAHGQADALATLVEAGAFVGAATAGPSGDGGDGEGELRRTALHWAAAKGREACVGILVKAGGDPNQPDGSGWTALHCALMHGHASTGAILVAQHKADPCALDLLGRDPLSYCLPKTAAAFEAALGAAREAAARGSSPAAAAASAPAAKKTPPKGKK